MGALLIHIAGNNWVADVANTNVQYAFVGADAQAQVGAVQQLAAAMQQGEAALVNGIDEIFVLAPGQDANAVVQGVFGTTDGIVFNDAVIFSDADNMLLDVLEDAGEALAAVLPA